MARRKAGHLVGGAISACSLFYGGWITPEIAGPFKGDPGTGGW